MTDCELLELAAKAAGVKKDDSPYNGGGFGNNGFDCVGNLVLDWHTNKRWNPLIDDSDALRLAVKLNFNIYSCDLYSIAELISDGLEYAVTKKEYCDSETKYAATRRAIVRAAAEIGKTIK